ncbi:hypothetical protein [Bradyrhizobium liaoningense]|uniref:hypothetical protein n=1 Tax=Bradyrhizobium liaoningense TaxID=43992 RepID=UPI002011E755|nr:hypothetical protein [Bradyrhizobium liaoningense]
MRGRSTRGGLGLSVSGLAVSNLGAGGGATGCEVVAARTGGGGGGGGTTAVACGGRTDASGQTGCGAWTTGAGGRCEAGAVPRSSIGRRLRLDTETQEADRQLRGASTRKRWPPIEKE